MKKGTIKKAVGAVRKVKAKVRGAVMKAVTTPARRKFGATKVNKARKELGY
jgi:hypothetical protein